MLAAALIATTLGATAYLVGITISVMIHKYRSLR